MRFIVAFFKLSACERGVLARAWRALWRFRILLWIMPWPRVQKMSSGAKPRSNSGSSRGAEDAVSPARIGALVSAASALVPFSTCLVQSLATQFLLRRAGFPADLRLGVAKNGGNFAAHAWVCCDGAIVIGGEAAPHYTPILSDGNGD